MGSLSIKIDHDTFKASYYMDLKRFFSHHKLKRNPFSEEDAQTDGVFRDHCIATTYHPAWDKVLGDLGYPTTSVVFGEKGSGKTAIRLQIARSVEDYNAENKDRRVFLVPYDDFNPLLDRFEVVCLRDHRFRGDSSSVLNHWVLEDHMDSILTLATTGLVRLVLGEDSGLAAAAETGDEQKSLRKKLKGLPSARCYDLLLLAAVYDSSTSETPVSRFQRLAAKLPVARHWGYLRDLAIGAGVSVLVLLLMLRQIWVGEFGLWTFLGLAGMTAAAWFPWLSRFVRGTLAGRGIQHNLRVSSRTADIWRQLLMRFPREELQIRSLPTKASTDDRYALLEKLQGILHQLGFASIVVVMDRIDEPHLINGSSLAMKKLIWPLLDNKLLKYEGIGFKLLLPQELIEYIDQETPEFYQRSRLDKQNMIRDFSWTAESLLSMANTRLRICAEKGASPSLQEMLSDDITPERLLLALAAVRVPRRLYKFIYQLFVAHCNSSVDDKPEWKVSLPVFERTAHEFMHQQVAYDRGMGAGG